jgi:hypothetical protein
LPLSRLRHHVTGAIERGEAQAITEIPASPSLPAHTPGPWSMDDDLIIAPGDDAVACLSSRMHGHYSNWQANARLIASAPALATRVAVLRAALAEAASSLKWCEAVYGRDWPDKASIRDTIADARAVLASTAPEERA